MYYWKVKGYLSAVDLIREIAVNKDEKYKIGKFEVLKGQLFPVFFAADVDAEAKTQVTEALKQIPLSKWEDRAFYSIEEHLTEKKAEEIPQVENAEQPKVAEAT